MLRRFMVAVRDQEPCKLSRNLNAFPTAHAVGYLLTLLRSYFQVFAVFKN
jgi:hypothetical protein